MSSNTSDIRSSGEARKKWEEFYKQLIEQTRFESESEEENSNFLLDYLMAGKEDLGEPDVRKQDELIQALQLADWAAPILNGENLEQIALQCFKDHRISYQQLITLLERQQQQLDFGLVETYALLEEGGQYTNYAAEIFFPALKESLKKKGMELDENKRERLYHLIKTLPKSEQMVYSSNIDEAKLYEGGILPGTDIYPSSDSLLGRMQVLGVVILDFDHAQMQFESISVSGSELISKHQVPLISMSDGVADAVSIAFFGVKRYVNPVFRRREMGVRDIENGVRKGFRPTAITLRNELPAELIHEFESPGRVASTAHDKYHAGIMSRMAPKHRSAFLHMINIARANLCAMHQREQMRRKAQGAIELVTMETWLATDAAWPIAPGIAFFTSEEIKKSTEIFCKNLSGVTIGTKSDNYSGFFDSEDKVSVFGMIIFIDMLRSREQWCQLFNVAPELLTGQFKIGYEFIKRLGSCDANFLNDSPELQALKLRVVQKIGDVSDNELSDLLKKIETYYHGSVNKGNPICEFARAKQGIELFDQKLLPNQVGLFVNPGHEVFFSEMHRKYFPEKSSSETSSDDEKKVSNKCCCFFNSAKKKNKSSAPKIDEVLEEDKPQEKKNNFPLEMEVVVEDEPVKQSQRRSRCVVL